MERARVASLANPGRVIEWNIDLEGELIRVRIVDGLIVWAMSFKTWPVTWGA